MRTRASTSNDYTIHLGILLTTFCTYVFKLTSVCIIIHAYTNLDIRLADIRVNLISHYANQK